MTLLVGPSTGSNRPSRPHGVPARRHAATVWIRAYSAVAALGAVVIAVVLASVAGGMRDGLTVIGQRTAPQVAAGEDLYFALSDMDAQLANLLLTGADPRLGRLHAFAVDDYEKDRARAGADLQQVTTVAGDDATVQGTVREVLDEFGRYQSLAARAMQLVDREGAGPASQDVVDLARQATVVLHAAVDSVRKLAVVNGKLLDQSYRDRQASTAAARQWLVGIGIVFLASLVGLQVVLRLRMRRRLNPAVAVATLLAGWLVFGGITQMNRQSDQLRSAKEDAFDSLMVLRQARAVSYDANADESRYLLDPGWAARYEQDFFDKSTALADVGASGLSEYDERLGVLLNVYRGNRSDLRIDGLFGAELNNITFPGERSAAEQVMLTYQRYQEDDGPIRQLVADGKLHEAIVFCLEPYADSSNYRFSRYDKALTHLIDINQRAFDSAIAAGTAELGGWTGTIPYGVGFLVVVLVAAGVWPRLAEYR
jgi:CHASE3 domain sensor protein